jgi:glycosyltransferase involved in cell wall biosynthesis
MERLKILWLSHFVPYPPKGGCFQRSYNLITRVGARCDLHLIAMRHKASTHPASEISGARHALLDACRGVEIVDISQATRGVGRLERAAAGLVSGKPFSVTVYQSQEMRARLAEQLARTRFDVVHFDTIGLAEYRDQVGAIPTLVTHHGAESHMIHRRIQHETNPLRKAFFRFEGAALERYERRMCGTFDVNVVMSDADGRLLSRIAPSARYVAVPNGVDLNYFTPVRPAREPRIVFAGRLDQYSNRDGLLHFMESAWPLIRAQFPTAVIDIIGHNPFDALTRLAAEDARVKVHGFVPDVRPYFASAMAAICPVRDGGGTRIKVFDALAQGVPLVSTPIGCEGIDVVGEEHVLLATTGEDFARQIGRLFREPALQSRLAANGRRLVEERYSWDALADGLLDQYRAISRATIARTA